MIELFKQKYHSCKGRNDTQFHKVKYTLFTLLLISFSIAYSNSFSKSDTLQIQNEFLSVKIVTKGAEIISIYNQKEKFEHLWQRDKASWNQQSPILFPIVGKLKGGTYHLDGKTYKMKNHGFASRQEFRVISQTDSQIVLELKENTETLIQYPFKFRLLMTYTLKGNKLSISNKVENRDSKEMYFSIGAHPGFQIPFSSDEKYDDFYLEFEQNETVARLPLTKEKGFLSQQKNENYLGGSNQMKLNHKLFKDRVVILEGLKSKHVTIKSDRSEMSVTVGIENFPYVGVWTSSKKEAPFICIEPWYGISDLENTSGDFKTKKGIQSLMVGKSFDMNYFIEIIN